MNQLVRLGTINCIIISGKVAVDIKWGILLYLLQNRSVKKK